MMQTEIAKLEYTDLAFFEIWLEEKKQLSEGSIKTYMQVIERFIKLDPDINKVDDYNRFIIDNSIKKRCYHYYSALKNFIEYKITDTGLRNRLIEQMIRPPYRTDTVKERKHLEEDELLNVINNLEKPKHRIMALIQTLTGIRAGDILRIRRDAIMPELYKGKPVLRFNIVGKGSRRNVIFIHDEIAQEVIMDFISNNYLHDDYYFIEPLKQYRMGYANNEFKLMRVNYNYYLLDLKQSLLKLGYEQGDFSTHDFRRTFSRRVWEKYRDIHILKNILNHSNINTTVRYLDQSGLKNVDYHFEMQGGESKK